MNKTIYNLFTNKLIKIRKLNEISENKIEFRKLNNFL